MSSRCNSRYQRAEVYEGYKQIKAGQITGDSMVDQNKKRVFKTVLTWLFVSVFIGCVDVVTSLDALMILQMAEVPT